MNVSSDGVAYKVEEMKKFSLLVSKLVVKNQYVVSLIKMICQVTYFSLAT